MGTPRKDRVRHFDFKKKPMRPWLLWLPKIIISFPDLKRRKAVIRKHDMEGIEGKPYLLLITHSSMVDFNIMLKATHPYPVNNVMSLEGFNTYTAPLMRSLGVLGKRKFTTDINLIRNIRYTLEELKNIFVLFPETRYSLDGCTSFLPESLGGLVKMMKVPCVVLNIHGNFVTNPQWNKKNKFCFVEADMFPVVKAEEIESLQAAEIFDRITKAFAYDDYRWQLENKVLIDHPTRANGLHCLLYKCPNCGAEHQTDSAGDTLWCNACGKRWRQNGYGQMEAEEGETEFSHIPDWSNWERDCVRREILDGTYYFEDEVRVETLPGWLKFYKHGKGKLIQTPEGTRIECTAYGEPTVIEKKPLDLYSMHVEYDYLGRGDCVDISTNDDSYWCYLTKRDAITKLSFATEEIFKIADAQRKTKQAQRAAFNEKVKAEA